MAVTEYKKTSRMMEKETGDISSISQPDAKHNPK